MLYYSMRERDAKEAEMKTFNVWKLDLQAKGPTGPWVFAGAILAANDIQAKLTAKSRFGLSGEYNVYEGLDD